MNLFKSPMTLTMFSVLSSLFLCHHYRFQATAVMDHDVDVFGQLSAAFCVVCCSQWCHGVVVKHADSQHRGRQFDSSMCHF